MLFNLYMTKDKVHSVKKKKVMAKEEKAKKKKKKKKKEKVMVKEEKALTGFEPVISCLLDRRFNQLSHRAN